MRVRDFIDIVIRSFGQGFGRSMGYAVVGEVRKTSWFHSFAIMLFGLVVLVLLGVLVFGFV